MSWCAYPWKDGAIVESPRLNSSSYASRLEELLHQNMYWQNPEGEPDYTAEDVKVWLKEMEHRWPIHDPCNGQLYWNEIAKFLHFCVERGCGVQVSF